MFNKIAVGVFCLSRRMKFLKDLNLLIFKTKYKNFNHIVNLLCAPLLILYCSLELFVLYHIFFICQVV
jgi:hypothetical protein